MDQEAIYWTCLVVVANCPPAHPDLEVWWLGGIWESTEDQRCAADQEAHLHRKGRVSQAILID